MADEDEFDEIGSNKTNPSNLSASKKSTKAGYLTFKSANKGNNNPEKSNANTKKCVNAAKSLDYLTPDAKKAFNHLRHIFT